MRITNTMISNNSRAHILSAKREVNKREEQYDLQKKILRPSDDPTIAIRSLKLRTTYSQLQQYAEKNVKDAMEWMNNTEKSLSNIGNVMTLMKEALNQGANDPLGSEERRGVLAKIKQYVSNIFEDEANKDFSGRYLFTGYRTDTSLLFPTETKNLAYSIKEHFTSDNIRSTTIVTGGARFDETITDPQNYVDQHADSHSVYRMQLAYKNCSKSSTGEGTRMPGTTVEDYVEFHLSLPDGTSADPTPPYEPITRSSEDTDAYTVGDDEVVFLYDKGELLLGKNVYSAIHSQNAKISVEYSKSEFAKNDIRPEMYFECTSFNSISNKTTPYADPSNQKINYEVNFSQTVDVNTQAKNAISTDIYRVIDYIEQTVNAVVDVETRISEVEKKIANLSEDDRENGQLDLYNQLKETLESEKTLRVSAMTEAYGMGLTMVDKTQEVVNIAVADLGAKYNRLQMTEEQLEEAMVNTEETMSDNEDISLPEAYINLTQANNLYQASLTATAKILGNTLLNYI